MSDHASTGRAAHLLQVADEIPAEGGRLADWARAAGWCSCRFKLGLEPCRPHYARTRRELLELYRLGLVDLVDGRLWVKVQPAKAMLRPLRRPPVRRQGGEGLGFHDGVNDAAEELGPLLVWGLDGGRQ